MSARSSRWRLAGIVLLCGLSLTEGGAVVIGQTRRLPLSPAQSAVPASVPQLTTISEDEPRSREDVSTFLKGISSNDARISVIVGQGRLLTLKQDLVQPEKQSPLIAVGNPAVLDFEVVGRRNLRIMGRRIGVTDLSITTPDNENYSFEVHVVADLEFLAASLQQMFPGSALELNQIRDHVVVGGQARDARQVSQIIDTISAYLLSVQTAAAAKTRSSQIAGGRNEAVPILRQGEPSNLENRAEVLQSLDQTEIEAQNPAAAIINLIHVPGPQQVLLKVQVAELNRTALRNLSVSMLFQNDGFAIGSGVGPRLLNRTTAGGGAAATDALLGLINPLTGGTTSTLFGVFDQGGANVFVDALRRNQVLKILAEPNLVAMNGQEANFLSGGEFPVPVPQPSSTGVGLVTIQFKPFGVGLKFVPYILDDGKVRLSVAPEVSSIDFNTGIVIQGTSVPGINTRRTSTTVELQEGQTLAISGILQVTIDGTTARIPGLGDLPYIGALFSNNSSETVEKELVVLVTPYLVKAMEPEQVPELPGADVLSPDDCEFYLQGRIEKRACRPYRATTAWDDPLGVQHRRRWESQQICGPYGYTE